MESTAKFACVNDIFRIPAVAFSVISNREKRNNLAYKPGFALIQEGCDTLIPQKVAEGMNAICALVPENKNDPVIFNVSFANILEFFGKGILICPEAAKVLSDKSLWNKEENQGAINAIRTACQTANPESMFKAVQDLDILFKKEKTNFLFFSTLCKHFSM